MSFNSKIEWTDATWNFLGGCSPCSPGCDNCAAARLAAGRLKNRPLYKGLTKNGRWTGEVRLCTEIDRGDILEQPMHWRKPRTVFPCFMGDLFHPAVPIRFLKHVFETIEKCPQHKFMILTKRPKQAISIMRNESFRFFEKVGDYWYILRNVHFGVSISNQTEAYEKIPILLKIPAAVRWLSIEPMLGPIDLETLISCPRCAPPSHFEPRLNYIDWVVVGGESGPGARPMHTDWVRNIRDQCNETGVPFFMKQMGGHPNKRANLKDIPKDLRIREYPRSMKRHSKLWQGGRVRFKNYAKWHTNPPYPDI